jgi:hypothetical protein
VCSGALEGSAAALARQPGLQTRSNGTGRAEFCCRRERFDSLARRRQRTLMSHAIGRAAMFYVKWFGQVMLVMVLISIVALLVPPPAITGLLLIAVIVWAVWLLRSLVRNLFFPSAPTSHRRRRERSAHYVLGAQVALTVGVTLPAESFARPPVAQRVKAGNAASSPRTCSSRMNPRVPRDSRGRSFPASFVYCRARRRLPAA